MSDLSETGELVRRASGGDELALNDLFSRHRERLRRMVRARLDWRVRGRVDDDDVLQEVYLRAAERLREYLRDPKVSFFLWLRSLTTQTLADVHRRHLGAKARDARREVRLLRSPAPEATSALLVSRLLGTATSPSERVSRAELKMRVQDALDAMTPEAREILILRHYEALTFDEIACEQGVERSTANKRYFRALRKIKRVLATMPGGLGAVGGKADDG